MLLAGPGLVALPSWTLALAVLPFLLQVWEPNVDDDTYRNPIIHADYSDPDVVRVGEDYFMTASSFTCVPALPILHSRDLVNWRIVNHAVEELPPAFDRPQHGDGVWAPTIEHHDGTFYIVWGDPDRGIYMTRTEDPRGRWTDPVLVHEAEGWIDPAPFWDDDGSAYLVHAFAKSRAGINSVLHVAPMAPDGTELTGESREVFDGHDDHPTIEGPKLYKLDGRYYIFAPAGGVRHGWQTVLRADEVFGPYEDRVVLEQGDTDVNGPHQGALVATAGGKDSPSDDDWFVHFQQRDPYGRIVHLQPVAWRDGWPVIGRDADGDGTGEPVRTHAKPDVPADGGDLPRMEPQTSDDFTDARLGLQWQWHGNRQYGWHSLTDRPDALRLDAAGTEGAETLHDVPNLLLQKFPAPSFTATTAVRCALGQDAGHCGLVVMGQAYATLSLERTGDGVELVQRRNTAPDEGQADDAVERVSLDGSAARLRATVADGGEVHFSYAGAEEQGGFASIGEPFQAQPGRWIGAKVGVFAVADDSTDGNGVGPGDTGFCDVEWFRIEG